MNTKPLNKLSLTPDQGYDFWGDKNRWLLYVNEKQVSACAPWKAVSPFGSVEAVVVTDDDGNPIFDRPVYREAPNVNCVAWGIDENGIVKVAVLHQPRPHSDDPENPGDDHKPVVFGQIPMGFLKKLIGCDAGELETMEAGAIREVGEETGAGAVISVERPLYPYLNPSPSFVATWSDLFFIKVDLEKVGELKKDRTEPIYSAEYITLSELRKRIACGKYEDAVYRYGNACAVWFIFMCHYPQFWDQFVIDLLL